MGPDFDPFQLSRVELFIFFKNSLIHFQHLIQTTKSLFLLLSNWLEKCLTYTVIIASQRQWFPSCFIGRTSSSKSTSSLVPFSFVLFKRIHHQLELTKRQCGSHMGQLCQMACRMEYSAVVLKRGALCQIKGYKTPFPHWNFSLFKRHKNKKFQFSQATSNKIRGGWGWDCGCGCQDNRSKQNCAGWKPGSSLAQARLPQIKGEGGEIMLKYCVFLMEKQGFVTSPLCYIILNPHLVTAC